MRTRIEEQLRTANRENMENTMKKITITVEVNLYDEYLGEEDVEVEISDEAYQKLEPLCEEMDADELEDEECHDLLEEKTPEVLAEIEQAVDNAMPDAITPQEDETIEDYSWTPLYNTIILDM